MHRGSTVVPRLHSSAELKLGIVHLPHQRNCSSCSIFCSCVARVQNIYKHKHCSHLVKNLSKVNFAPLCELMGGIRHFFILASIWMGSFFYMHAYFPENSSCFSIMPIVKYALTSHLFSKYSIVKSFHHRAFKTSMV